MVNDSREAPLRAAWLTSSVLLATGPSRNIHLGPPTARLETHPASATEVSNRRRRISHLRSITAETIMQRQGSRTGSRCHTRRMSMQGDLEGFGRRVPALTQLPAWGGTFAVGAVCVATAGLLSTLILHESGLSGDEPYYERMASHPAGPHNFPYAFRVGPPGLVHLLPFSHAVSWQLLALAAIAVAGGALFAILREFGTNPALAVGMCVGFAGSPVLLAVLLRNGRGIDAAIIAVMTLGYLFIVRRQLVLLSVTLMVGTTIHESCLFLIPAAYAVWAERLLDPKALRTTLWVGALPLAVYIYLRMSVVAVGEQYQPGYGGSVLAGRIEVLNDAIKGGGWKTELRRLVLTFGPLWIAAVFALRTHRFARRGLVLIGLCVLSFTFALDWGRIMSFATPVVYVSAALVLRKRPGWAFAVVLILIAMDVSYAVYMQLHGVVHGLDTHGPPARGPVV